MRIFLSFLTLSLLLGIGVANAQNQRTVVLECFTSATCGPCASANPALDNLVNNNADKLIAIKYHVNWPVAGDPMNLHNPSEVSSKVSYYGINSVPYSVGDGTWSGLSSSVNQTKVDQWAAVPSPLEMRMTYYLNNTQDTIYVIVMGRATSDITSDNLRLNIAVLEKTMTYTSAPCASSNGERVFHNVMKKLLPTATGTAIPAMQTGDYFAYKYSWALANVMNVSELTAVAWVQDYSTKQIFQGCQTLDEFQPFYAKQAKISAIDHAKKKVCSGSMNPYIIIDNFGYEPINSLLINVSVNGAPVAQLGWNGVIEPGRSGKIDLGNLYFGFTSNNNMSISIAQINGAADDYAPSIFNYDFESSALICNQTFKLVIRTDDDPQAITWDVVNTANGDIVAAGGPYDEAHHNYNEEFNLDESGCYTLTIYDAMGNGLASGNGLYGLKVGSQTIIAGSSFTDKESNDFSFSKYEDISETPVNTINIYPNPSNGIVTVEVEEGGMLKVYNTAGQKVVEQSIDGKTTLNLSSLDKGTYLIVLTDMYGASNKQVIVLQ